jgi:eukaryotic-like serine/threonine-protein kinase
MSLDRQTWIWAHAGQLAEPVSLGDRFDLEVQLDAGATATVWQAFDRKLSRRVALKVFHAPSCSALREARAASEVISEHVVRVHDVHDDPAYLVLELVAERETDGALQLGASAAATEPRDLDEAVRWARDVARGVDAAHLHGVFHRDLKPHNVLITPISRRAKIADFGLATSSAEPTIERGVSGTPEYIAPELARAVLYARPPTSERALAAIDVWGLGAIAHALIAGTPPWPERGLAAWELAATGAPAPLDRTRWGRRVPHRLRAIIARALALSPAARYPSASAFAGELDAYLAHRPTTVDRGPVIRARLWMRRNPHLSVMASVVLALGGISAAAYANLRAIHAEHTALERDVARLATDKRELEAEARTTELDLARERARLAETASSLASAERELAVSRLAATTTARKLELNDAATRLLETRIYDTQSDLGAAEAARELYEQLWLRARDETAAAVVERDVARRDRDAARRDRDRAIGEREAAHSARVLVERELAALRDRGERNHETERELSRIDGELSTIRTNLKDDAPRHDDAKGAVN